MLSYCVSLFLSLFFPDIRTRQYRLPRQIDSFCMCFLQVRFLVVRAFALLFLRVEPRTRNIQALVRRICAIPAVLSEDSRTCIQPPVCLIPFFSEASCKCSSRMFPPTKECLPRMFYNSRS